MRKLSVALATLFAASLAFMGSAYAQVSDPTGGAADTLRGDVADWVQSYGIPALVGLLFIGIVVGLLVKYVRRGARAA
jgi:uncharacterized membrane protein